MWTTLKSYDHIFMIGDTMIRESDVSMSMPCDDGKKTKIILNCGREEVIDITPTEFIKSLKLAIGINSQRK